MADALFIAILAAGASRRLGQPKQLVQHNGESLVHRQCRVAIEAGIGKVAVTLGCEQDRCRAEVADLPVTVLTNDNWAEGMASSVRLATEAAMADHAAALLLMHCDQFAIIASDLVRLHDAWRSSPATAILSRAGSYLGPPAILPARLFAAMLTLEGDTGPRSLLRNDLKVSELILPNAASDLDHPEDLQRL
jgi:CTP:molybdopterin cytidylyltransferase MocA